MPELDAFERRFGRAIRRYQSEIATDVDAWAVARVAVEARSRRIVWPWALRPARELVWLVVAAMLLTALLVGGLLVGSRQAPIALACPPGSDPDAAGPGDQARPPWAYVQGMAFDSHARRIVAHATETWTFDVCANTWEQMRPAVEAPEARSTLVYDPNADLTLAIAGGSVWAYDLAANTWTARGTVPEGTDRFVHLIYDPVSRLVIAAAGREPFAMWTYDVATDTWARIAETGRPTVDERMIMAYDPSVDRVVVYEGSWPGPASWTFDPRTGVWSPATYDAPSITYDWAVSGGEIAYDPATQQTIVMSNGKVVAYDARAERWQVLVDPLGAESSGFGPTVIGRPTVVYDSLNERLVVYGSEYRSGTAEWRQPSGVFAFEPATGTWTTLLEP